MAEYRRGYKVDPETGLTAPEARAGLTREQAEAQKVQEAGTAPPPALAETTTAVTPAAKRGHRTAWIVAETVAQENARESAQSYLEAQHFSRKGLIDQLKFEGYSAADATDAVDKVAYRGIWSEQVAGAAKDYLDGQSFSRSG